MDKAQMSSLREYLVWALETGDAHATFEAAVEDFPEKMRGARAPGLPHTGWQLLEHLRLAQEDIIEFSRSATYVSSEWPAGYWPEKEAPSSETAWTNSVAAFLRDREVMQRFVRDPRTDLFTPLSWGSGQTVFREVMLLADHNAYHIGQMVLLRRALGCWK